MKNFCSVHTHSTMCDGKNTLAEMARAAYEAGAVSFGASGHSHTSIPEDEGGVLPADMTAYRAEVLRLREEYAGRMDVLLGIELDNRADVTAEGFDYWIGSVHRLRGPDGVDCTVDWDAETLGRCLREAFHGDSGEMAARYYEEVRQMAARKPDILGTLTSSRSSMRTAVSSTRPAPATGPPPWRPSTPPTRRRLCWRSTPGPCPGDTGASLTRRCSCCGSGGTWGGGSFSPPTPTAPPPWCMAMPRRRPWPRRRALTVPHC